VNKNVKLFKINIMNSNKFFKKSIILIVMMLLLNALIAQDKITFTWQGSHRCLGAKLDYGYFDIRATNGEQFTIDWGDGTPIETKIGLGDANIYLHHNYTGNDDSCTVTIAAVSVDCKFTYLDCHSDFCDDVIAFQISSLLLECSNLSYLSCDRNCLQLSDLYAAHLIINEQSGKLFGWQFLPYQPLTGGMTVDFSAQRIFGGVETVFDVWKGEQQAILNVDYTIDNGVISFVNDGKYIVHMSNEAIVSHLYPAVVVAGDDVFSLNIPEKYLPNFKIYPNPTNDIVYIKTDTGIIPELKLYSLDGRLLQQMCNTEINLSGYSAGIYLLSINGKTVRVVKK